MSIFAWVESCLGAMETLLIISGSKAQMLLLSEQEGGKQLFALPAMKTAFRQYQAWSWCKSEKYLIPHPNPLFHQLHLDLPMRIVLDAMSPVSVYHVTLERLTLPYFYSFWTSLFVSFVSFGIKMMFQNCVWCTYLYICWKPQSTVTKKDYHIWLDTLSTDLLRIYPTHL